MNNNKIYTRNFNLRLKNTQFNSLTQVCNQLEMSKAEFIRDAMEEKIDRHSIEAK